MLYKKVDTFNSQEKEQDREKRKVWKIGRRKYEKGYKVQVVKLAQEIEAEKAAQELGVPVDTLYGWQKAVREGRLDAGPGSHTPETAMSLAEASAFSPRAVGSQQGTANDVYREENGRRREDRQAIPILPGTVGKPTGLLPVPDAAGLALEVPGSCRRHVGDPQ